MYICVDIIIHQTQGVMNYFKKEGNRGDPGGGHPGFFVNFLSQNDAKFKSYRCI